MPSTRTSGLDDLDGRHVVVTGGAGFVGSNTVDRLLELGATVVLFDDLSTGSEETLPYHSELELVRGSVCDYDLVRQTLDGAEIVLHLAARNIILSMRNPHDDYEVN